MTADRPDRADVAYANPATPATGAAPHSRPDSEQIYYKGSPKLRGELGLFALWFVIGAVLFFSPILLSYYGNVNVPYWLIAAGILLGLGCWSMPALLVRRNYYTITNYRIDFEHGILFKKLDTLELWHVDDVSLSQSPIDRIFRVGTIDIVSNDATNPTLTLHSVSDPRPLYETIKQRIIAVKRQRGVIKLDS